MARNIATLVDKEEMMLLLQNYIDYFPIPYSSQAGAAPLYIKLTQRPTVAQSAAPQQQDLFKQKPQNFTPQFRR